MGRDKSYEAGGGLELVERRSREGRNVAADRQRYRENQMIFREGESGDIAFIVVKGVVEITRRAGHGETVIASIRRGGMFGELALIDDLPRMASARAVSADVEVLIINRKLFQRKLSRLDPFTQGLIKILSADLRAVPARK